MKNRTAMFALAGAVVLASSIGAVAGCLSLNRGGTDIQAGSGTPSPSSAATTATAGAPATKPAPKKTTTTTRTSRPPEAGPRIVHFRIARQPSCPQGTSEYPVEGTPVILEWKVTGVDQVTLSVDGPGVYDTYPAEGRQELNFPCDGDPGETVTHTYLLKTVGGGPVKSKTLTASAEVYEVADV
jgi:hypothetical protein